MLTDVQKFDYHRNEKGGFTLGYHAADGFSMSSTFAAGTNEAQPTNSANGASSRR
jgi:hypothetical protein